VIFTSTDLAARIERAECGLLTEACASARRRLGDGVFAIPVSGGVATFSEPGSPLNKVAGLGFGGPLTVEDAGTVEAAYAARGVPVRVEVSTLADPGIVKQLTGRGYRLVAFENVLGLALPAQGLRTGSEIRIERSGPDQFDAWLDIVVTGFASPDTQGVPSHEQYDRDVLDRIMRDFSQARSVLRYIAHRGESPAGAGIMRIEEGVAQLGGAATLPSHRRRGVQTTLISSRLADAARHGCDIAVVSTEPASRSQENLQRVGFEVLYVRAVLVRE
jgi:GNAT superfamily N-acetyltransferase